MRWSGFRRQSPEALGCVPGLIFLVGDECGRRGNPIRPRAGGRAVLALVGVGKQCVGLAFLSSSDDALRSISWRRCRCPTSGVSWMDMPVRG